MGTEKPGSEHWQALLDDTMQGDHDAFGTLWQEYLKPKQVFPYALRLLKNHHDAEDVADEVFLYLYDQAYYQSIRRRDLAGFVNCVCKMTYNMAVDHVRRHKQTRFVITSETLEQLHLSGVSDEVLAALNDLQYERPVGRQKFVDLLAAVLRDQFTAWVKRIILKYSRYERARWEPYTDDMASYPIEPRTPHDEAAYHELVRIVDEIRRELSGEEWDVFYHKYTDDNFSYRAYSEQTGIPLTTLHSRCQRAREKIMNHYKLRGYWKNNAAG